MLLQHYYISELLHLGISKIRHLLSSKKPYYNNYGLLRSEISLYLDMGFLVKRSEGNIVIFGNENYKGLTCFIRPLSSDRAVFDQIFVQAEYSAIVLQIKNAGAENSIKTIVDAGANIGLASVYFSRAFPTAKILAIEPHEESFVQCKKNLEANSSISHIVYRSALWVNDTENLSISNNFRDGKSWSNAVVLSEEHSTNLLNLITLRRLAVVAESGVIDLLKIDIEGSEASLFKDDDFCEVLANHVRFLCVEIHDEFNCREYILDTLERLGFAFSTKAETTFAENSRQFAR